MAKEKHNQILFSIIIPFLDESNVIDSLLINLEQVFGLAAEGGEQVELIFVDGGSQDDSQQKIKGFFRNICFEQVSLISSEAGRAKQMNAGAKLAKGKCYVFLHVDTLLSRDTLNVLNNFLQQHEKAWGSFTLKLDDENFSYRLLESMINLRSELTKVVTGDQVLFVKQDVFDEISGFPDIALMEDVAITKKLRTLTKPYRVKTPVVSSSRRWKKKGMLKTILLMWYLRLAFVLGVHPDRLFKKYYSNE